MVVKKLLKPLKNNKGQAVFELVLFVPIFLYLMSVLLNVGNSINSSINQQKATRGYTYYLLKGNSYTHRKTDLRALEAGSTDQVQNLGSYIIGWRLKRYGAEGSIGTYYQMPNVPFSSSIDEDCEEPGDDNETTCLKVFTLYGVCGETYSRIGGSSYARIDYPLPGSPGMALKSLCVFY